MTKSQPPTTVGHVAAAPGTRIVLLYADFTTGDAAAAECLVSTRELAVICWEIRKTSHGHTWAKPVTTEIINDYDEYVVVMPDGQIDLTSPIAYDEEFAGKTLDDVVTWLDQQTRVEIRRTRCMDCDKDLRQSGMWGLEADAPIINDTLWESIVPDDRGGMLCKADMESRLGRPLTAQDVKKQPPRHV